MSSDQLRWGVVGCGDVVFNKSGPSIMQAGRSKIVAVMRRQPDMARDFAEANGIAVCTDDATAVIEHPEVDIVYVATPPVNHLAYTLAAAKAGKHVLCEKPMGMSAAEDLQMIEACEAAGVELFTAYYRRFHPHVVKMKQLIVDGVIGRPVMGRIDYRQTLAAGYDYGWRLKKDIAGGGLFFDVVVHRIDVMNYLLGRPVKSVGVKSYFDKDSEVEQMACLSVGYENGATCSVMGDFLTTGFRDGFTITGTKGCIHSERLDGHSFELTVGDEIETFEFQPFAAPHLGQIQHIESVLLDGAKNLCSGVDGRMTDVILDAAIRE